jgi:fibronectin type 3 domain-containing protein
MKTPHLFLLLILLAMIASVRAQAPNSQAGLHLLSTYQEGAVWLRWAPATPSQWLEANQRGYQVFRQEVVAGKAFDPQAFRLLTPEPIKPLSLQAMQAVHEQRSRYYAAAAQCLYGEKVLAQNGLADGLEAVEDLKNRFTLFLMAAEMDFQTAREVALGFVDPDVQPGKQYLYRVQVYSPADTSLNQAYARQRCVPQAAKVPELGEISEGEGRVSLHWLRKTHEPHFSAYHIEASEDGHTFTRINDAPFVYGRSDAERLQTSLISYPVEVSNYQPRSYRIRGIDPFGRLSEPSNSIRAMGRDRTPPARPTALSTEVDEENRVLVSWEMPDSSPDLAGFRVLRSFEYQGEQQLLSHDLPSTSRSFTDMVPNFVGINYYQVVALDTAGNEAPSARVVGFVEDHEAPAAPQQLTAAVNDSSGRVSLRWAQSPEPDVAGYRVFFANSLGETFVSRTNHLLSVPHFEDTLQRKSLSRKVYYKVVAVDRRGNISPFSRPLRVKRPDIIPPAQALFQPWQLQDQGIVLSWIPSSSKDLKRQELWRKEKEGNWTKWESFSPQARSYTDSAIVPGTTYAYRLISVDSAGLESSSKVLSLQTRPVQIALEEAIRIAPDPRQESFRLQWPKPEQEIKRWVIYRAEAEGPLSTYASLQQDETLFEDKKVKKGVTYRYAMRAVYPDGRRSPLSTEVLGVLW